MKHSITVSILIILLFFFSQVIGLFILSQDFNIIETPAGPVPVHPETAIGPRPDIKGAATLIYITSAIVIGTVILLLLIRFRQKKIWKLWFFLAIWMTSMLALGVFFPPTIAALIGLFMTLWKMLWPNVIIHNVTEIFIYSGIAVMLVPLLDLKFAVLLLLLISLYDYYAVRKSRHMITMAKFQSGTQMFAGLSIPYSRADGKIVGRVPASALSETAKKGGIRTAILGGGDIAFPLLFAGVVMEDLIKVNHLSAIGALGHSLLLPVFTSVALLSLLVLGEKDRFYPAMPFLTAGCFMGLALIKIILLF